MNYKNKDREIETLKMRNLTVVKVLKVNISSHL